MGRWLVLQVNLTRLKVYYFLSVEELLLLLISQVLRVIRADVILTQKVRVANIAPFGALHTQDQTPPGLGEDTDLPVFLGKAL